MNSRHAVISDSQWELRTPFMPDSTDKAGRPFNDHSLMTEGIFSPSFAGPDGTKVTNFPFRRIFMIGRKFG